MKKCAIITAYIEGSIVELLPDINDYFIICADGGYALALQESIVPDMVIGDFDSCDPLVWKQGTLPENCEVIRLPVEKNHTDTGFAVEWAMARGFRHIAIIGGIGGRLDHTVANLQIIAGAAKNGAHIKMLSSNEEATSLCNGSITLPRRDGFTLSVLSLSEISEGVNLTGVKYPLTDATLTYTFPLGVSNSIIADEASISVSNGCLLILTSKDS